MKKKLNSILLIDDDPISNFLTERLLLKIGAARNITVASNAIQALEIIDDCLEFEDSCPEVIFLDINMPVMSGIDFLYSFKDKKFKNGQKSTIVVVSTSDNHKDQKEIKSLGVKLILQKPLTESKLKEVWEEATKQSSTNN